MIVQKARGAARPWWGSQLYFRAPLFGACSLRCLTEVTARASCPFMDHLSHEWKSRPRLWPLCLRELPLDIIPSCRGASGWHLASDKQPSSNPLHTQGMERLQARLPVSGPDIHPCKAPGTPPFCNGWAGPPSRGLRIEVQGKLRENFPTVLTYRVIPNTFAPERYHHCV